MLSSNEQNNLDSKGRPRPVSTKIQDDSAVKLLISKHFYSTVTEIDDGQIQHKETQVHSTHSTV